MIFLCCRWFKEVEQIYRTFMQERNWSYDHPVTGPFFDAVAILMSNQMREIMQSSIVKYHAFFLRYKEERVCVVIQSHLNVILVHCTPNYSITSIFRSCRLICRAISLNSRNFTNRQASEVPLRMCPLLEDEDPGHLSRPAQVPFYLEYPPYLAHRPPPELLLTETEHLFYQVPLRWCLQPLLEVQPPPRRLTPLLLHPSYLRHSL